MLAHSNNCIHSRIHQSRVGYEEGSHIDHHHPLDKFPHLTLWTPRKDFSECLQLFVPTQEKPLSSTTEKGEAATPQSLHGLIIHFLAPLWAAVCKGGGGGSGSAVRQKSILVGWENNSYIHTSLPVHVCSRQIIIEHYKPDIFSISICEGLYGCS